MQNSSILILQESQVMNVIMQNNKPYLEDISLANMPQLIRYRLGGTETILSILLFSVFQSYQTSYLLSITFIFVRCKAAATYVKSIV